MVMKYIDIGVEDAENKPLDSAMEIEASEIERIYEKRPLASINKWFVIDKVFNRVMERFHSVEFGLTAIYTMGYICGVRAERRRRAEQKSKL